ncbi:hypothetical protein Zmor_025674 [Zophobas morio]|uniref:RNA-directed DNA polymerase n=1 Tax=Zophobas morio TaxID=2755281 RepID=A0AA38HUN2_9CUCU|nr:hypothetical protein Zmor_025674 [Zophobas morio]
MEKCKMRARSVVVWPGITKQIENIVSRCRICEKYQHNRKETLITYPVSNRAWEKIAADILTFQRVDYLLVIYYLSNWIELVRLSGKTATDVIMKLKENFSRNGIPEILISNNMPFNSVLFKEFAKEWDFKVVTSRPRYAQSNGLAERGVKIGKNILRKAWEQKIDIYIYIYISDGI